MNLELERKLRSLRLSGMAQAVRRRATRRPSITSWPTATFWNCWWRTS
jgi:hypothetical protein